MDPSLGVRAEKAVSTDLLAGEEDHYVCVGVLESHGALIISKYILCNVSALQPSSINYMPLCVGKLVFLGCGQGFRNRDTSIFMEKRLTFVPSLTFVFYPLANRPRAEREGVWLKQKRCSCFCHYKAWA